MADKILTQDYLQSIFEYKDGNFYRKKTTTNSVNIGDKAGWMAHNGYYAVSVLSKKQYLHRLIFLYHHGYLPKFIDHIDGNPSNNKIENLREATQSQNMANAIGKNKNQLKGTTFDKKRNKWVASIMLNYKRIYIGGFDTMQEAHFAYKQKAKEIFKEYTK